MMRECDSFTRGGGERGDAAGERVSADGWREHWQEGNRIGESGNAGPQVIEAGQRRRRKFGRNMKAGKGHGLAGRTGLLGALQKERGEEKGVESRGA